MELIKHGLDRAVNPLEEGEFWQTLEDILIANIPDAKKRQYIVEAIFSSLSLPPNGRTPEQTEQMYTRFVGCIRRATGSLRGYVKDLLVQDVYQRVMPSSFIRHTADPLLLIDCMVTQAGRDERLRFEARRALYFGALFFEYETALGTAEQLDAEIAGVDRFFEARFSFGRNRNTRIYHKIRESEGYLEGYAVRVPLFDHSDDTRRNFENYFPVTFRPLAIPGVQQSEIQTHCMYDSRVKTELSAALKAMRKGTPIRSLKDCLGVTLYLFPGCEDAFDDIVETLTTMLPIETSDRLTHPSRRISSGHTDHTDENPMSSSRFKMEKMIALWSPATIFSQEKDTIERALPFSSLANRDSFFSNQQTLRPMTVEIQIGLLEDFINNHLVGSDENRLFYEVRRATEKIRDDAVPVLDALLPRELFGIRFNDPVIVQALVQKQRSQLGVHHQALERLSRDI